MTVGFYRITASPPSQRQLLKAYPYNTEYVSTMLASDENKSLKITLPGECHNTVNILQNQKQQTTTHPQLQMSTAGPYRSSPSSSSGGLYQSVITLLV